MNEKQIASIEKKFACKLPKGYREMLLAPPSFLVALLKLEEKDCPGQTPFFTNARMISGVNDWVRNPTDDDYFEFDPNDDSVAWPERYFIIGSTVGGDFYCLAPKTGRSRVYYWTQGDTGFTKFADGMRSFVKKLFRNYYAEVACFDCPSDEN